MVNVPNVPGVPALNRAGNAFLPNISILISDVIAVLNFFRTVTWGIFDENGAPAIVGSNVRAISVNNDASISNYPVEQGAFYSYNKVQNPYDVVVTFTRDGSSDARNDFLRRVDAAQKSLRQFTVVTQEVTYPNVNVVGYNYRRTLRQGANMLTVDVLCQQVRQAPAVAFSSTMIPDAAADIIIGTVQPQDLTVEQSANITTKLRVSAGGAAP